MPSNNILNKLKDHGTSGKHDLAPSTVGNDGSSITKTTGVTTTTTRTRRSKRQKKCEFQQFDPVFVIWDDNAEYPGFINRVFEGGRYDVFMDETDTTLWTRSTINKKYLRRRQTEEKFDRNKYVVGQEEVDSISNSNDTPTTEKKVNKAKTKKESKWKGDVKFESTLNGSSSNCSSNFKSKKVKIKKEYKYVKREFSSNGGSSSNNNNSKSKKVTGEKESWKGEVKHEFSSNSGSSSSNSKSKQIKRKKEVKCNNVNTNFKWKNIGPFKVEDKIYDFLNDEEGLEDENGVEYPIVEPIKTLEDIFMFHFNPWISSKKKLNRHFGTFLREGLVCVGWYLLPVNDICFMHQMNINNVREFMKLSPGFGAQFPIVATHNWMQNPDMSHLRSQDKYKYNMDQQHVGRSRLNLMAKDWNGGKSIIPWYFGRAKLGAHVIMRHSSGYQNCPYTKLTCPFLYTNDGRYIPGARSGVYVIGEIVDLPPGTMLEPEVIPEMDAHGDLIWTQTRLRVSWKRMGMLGMLQEETKSYLKGIVNSTASPLISNPGNEYKGRNPRKDLWEKAVYEIPTVENGGLYKPTLEEILHIRMEITDLREVDDHNN